MKVAVTGATGFVGRHLVRHLVSEGHEVIALSHRRQQPSEIPAGVTYVRASIDEPAELAAAFKGTEAVLHLVGIIVETAGKTFEKTVARGTANAVRAAESAGVRRFVYLSAMGTSAQAPSKYHQTKYRAEQTVASSGMEYVILRASLIYGPGDGFVSLLSRMINRSPFIPVIGSGRYRMQPVYIDDLTAVMVKSLVSAEAAGGIFDVGGPEKLEYLEILDIIKRTLGKRRMNLHLPVMLMRSAAAVLEQMPWAPALTRDQITMMEMGNTGDIEKMVNLLGVIPIPLEEGLRRYLS